MTAKVQQLSTIAKAGDNMAILVNADPDALASALALKRLFWRKVRPVQIVRINRIDRADNLAFVKLLDIRHHHLRALRKSDITKWALVDSQPSHNEQFAGIDFDVVINAGFKRNAGKLARGLFGDVGSAGGHKDSARAEIPLKNIDCGSDEQNDCRQYVLKRIRSLSG